ncbi:hypothetical protein J3R83DRAFT_13404, partial [Lanmaoa asiatica]
GSIRIFNSNNGDELIVLKTVVPSLVHPSILLAWSNDGQRLFTASKGNKIRSFDTSTGSEITDSQVLHGDSTVEFVALTTNGKFIAAYASSFISFLDTSTLSHIDSVIEESGATSIAVSPDSSYLAAGRHDGKIVIHNLGSILPDLYSPFDVSISIFTMLACPISSILSSMLVYYIRRLLVSKDNQKSSPRHQATMIA